MGTYTSPPSILADAIMYKRFLLYLRKKYRENHFLVSGISTIRFFDITYISLCNPHLLYEKNEPGRMKYIKDLLFPTRIGLFSASIAQF